MTKNKKQIYDEQLNDELQETNVMTLVDNNKVRFILLSSSIRSQATIQTAAAPATKR